jgi:hypothetical protein
VRTVSKQSKSIKHSAGPQPAVTAPIVFTPDGQVLLNVTECSGRDLEGRAQFIGVLMSRKEARFARKVVEDAASDAASKIAARMPVKKTTAKARSTAKTDTTPRSGDPRRSRGAPSGISEASSATSSRKTARPVGRRV